MTADPDALLYTKIKQERKSKRTNSTGVLSGSMIPVVPLVDVGKCKEGSTDVLKPPFPPLRRAVEVGSGAPSDLDSVVSLFPRVLPLPNFVVSAEVLDTVIPTIDGSGDTVMYD